MATTKSAIHHLDDLSEPPYDLTVEEAEQVKGGIGMLLPAVQKVREAASNSSTDSSDTLADGSVQKVQKVQTY